MIKAIFFDVDGTLFTHDTMEVPASTKLAFKKLKEKGIKIFMASGRHKYYLQFLPIEDLSFDGYITVNGQYCYNDEGVIHKDPIPQSDVDALIDLIHTYDFPCVIQDDTDIYINKVNEDVIDTQQKIHSPIPEIREIKGDKEYYIVSPYTPDKDIVDKITSSMIHCKWNTWFAGIGLDIFHDQGGKEKGIQAFLDYYGIDREETMAFGDGRNDIDMIKYCHIGIAMGNGREEVKQAADYVTDAVNDDGIYNALVKYGVIE